MTGHDTAPPVRARATRGPELSRRAFLTAAGGVLFAFTLPSVARTPRAAAAGAGQQLGAWVTINPDNTVLIQIGSTEMGQGVLTSLAQLVAEEMRVDWTQVTAQHSQASATYGNPAYGGSQTTGGSYSVRGYWTALRTVGAQVRTVLQQQAANVWKIPITSCVANHGVVTDYYSGRTQTYAQLAPGAAALTPPANPSLHEQKRWTVLGQSVPRLDIPGKVNGSAVYSPDVRLPGMLYAAVRHGPKLGQTVATVGSPPSGVTIVNLGNAIAAVASTWWGAFSGSTGTPVTWNTPAAVAGYDSAAILSQASTLMANPPSTMATAESNGNAKSAIAGAAKTLSVTYDVPYLVHGALEPVTCTTLYTSTSCSMWASTQVQSSAVAVAASITGLPQSAITLTTPLLGGGLGRKLETDFIDQSVRIAMAHPGVPVQLMWPRREEFTNDLFKPMALSNVQAGIDSAGNVVGWWNRLVTPSILAQKGYLSGTVDDQAVEGAVAQPYTWATTSDLVEWVPHPAGVQIGFWRSVGHSHNAFVVESAMDELAALAGMDPVSFRLQNLPSGGRHATVLQAVASMAGWPGAPSGHAFGLALHEAMGSIVGMVVEVSQPAAGQIKVHNAWVAIDCGIAANPDGVKAQMEGGVVHGLNAALYAKTTLTQGVVTPTTYNGTLSMIRMKDMPSVTVQIVTSNGPIGGVGEPGSPPVAPAVANAWFRLTGTRLRSLPMF